MGRYRAREVKISRFVLQEAIDASDLIGRWQYDISNDRAYTDALVALVLNIDPAQAAAGVSIRTILAGVHPEDRERTAAHFARNAQTGRRGVFEYRVRSADGVVRWVLDRGRISLDEAGRPVRGSGVLIDITRLRGRSGDAMSPADSRSEAVVRAAEHWLAAHKAIHELPEPLLHRMSDMLLREVGQTLAKLTGAGPSEGWN